MNVYNEIINTEVPTRAGSKHHNPTPNYTYPDGVTVYRGYSIASGPYIDIRNSAGHLISRVFFLPETRAILSEVKRDHGTDTPSQARGQSSG